MADDIDQQHKPSVSFGFSKKLESKKLTKSVASDGTDDKKQDPDFVLSLEGNEVKSTAPKPKQKEYIIPLIKQNKWRSDKEKRLADLKTVADENDLDLQAAKEVLEETSKYNESWDDRGKPDPNLAIPLLMQNKVPEGYETDDKLDVALRPDVPDDADYEQIPIEHFGVAMLRGMGWKEGEGIGKNSKVIAPIEATLRPKGLGLGADRGQSAGNKKKGREATDAVTDKEGLEMKKGAFCMIMNGKHKDLYGVVEGIDEDNARLVVKLALSGQSITMTQYNVKIVGRKEYDKYSKYLNKGKADKYKEKVSMQNGQDRHSDDDDGRSRDDCGSIDRDRHSDKRGRRDDRYHSDRNSTDKDRKSDKHKHKQKKRKHESREREDEENKHHKSSSSLSRQQESDSPSYSASNLWLCPNLRVRIVDKNYKKGKFYKEKVVVVDVVSRDRAVCKTDDGKVLEGLSHSQLETVIPRSDDSSHVMLCAGKHQRQLAMLVKKDKDSCKALVQLVRDRHVVLKVEFDEICEYVGSVEDFE